MLPPLKDQYRLSCFLATRGLSFQKMAQFTWGYSRQNLVNGDIQYFIVKYTSLCQMPALRFKPENFSFFISDQFVLVFSLICSYVLGLVTLRWLVVESQIIIIIIDIVCDFV